MGIKLFAETDFEMNLPAGWSMISLPVLPYNATASALFQGAIVIYRSNMGAGYARVQINELLQMSVG